MGTRSLTIFQDKANNGLELREYVVMYRQMDGYPDGHGLELAEFLSAFTVRNGLSVTTPATKTANGMACLSAQAIAFFKIAPGNHYLEPAGSRNMGEEYKYYVYVDRPNGFASGPFPITLQCFSTYASDKGKKDRLGNPGLLFEGTPEQFIEEFGQDDA